MMAWVWVGVALITAVIAVSIWALRSLRRQIRTRFEFLLQQRLDGVRIETIDGGHFLVRGRSGPLGRGVWGPIYAAVANTGSEEHDLDAALAPFLETILATADGPTASIDDGADLLPRLCNADSLAELRGRTDVCSVPLAGTPLHTVYLHDRDHTVTYVTEQMRDALGLSLPELHELAVDNLAARTPDISSILAGEERSVTFHTSDTYDAARLLALPRQLLSGQALLCIVPDRDTLVIARDTDDATAASDLRALLAEDALCDQVLRAKPDGIELLL